MKLILRNVILLLLLVEAVAFLAPSALVGKAKSSLSMQMVSPKDEASLVNSIKAFGLAAAIFVTVGSPVQVMAQESSLSQSQDIIYSSSIQVAETIKTMDMSLPSSYDAISDVKKSSVDELSREENLITGTVVKKAPKAATERMGVGEKMTKEEKAAQKAEEAARKKADKEAAAAEKAALDAEKKAERDVLQKEKAAEKAAEREAANKEKAAKKKAKAKAESVKEEKVMEKQYESYKFVDTGLPSYGDSTTSKERGAFSL